MAQVLTQIFNPITVLEGSLESLESIGLSIDKVSFKHFIIVISLRYS